MMHIHDMNKISDLRTKLKSFQIFNGMLVHDMRGPVSSMTIVLEEVNQLINDI